MQGHGHGQSVKKPPHTGWLVFLRVLFVALGFLSFGLLAWAMMLRLAAVTRRSLDWGLFVATLVADILSFVLLGSEPGDDIHTTGGYVGVVLLLILFVGAPAYYLAADIRHFMERQTHLTQQVAPAYGYPGHPSPYTATTTPSAGFRPVGYVSGTPAFADAPVAPPLPPRPSAVPHTPVAPSPPNTPPPRHPAPARIDQVRAELDELSDYLRQHGGGRDDGHGGVPGHEGGR
ncbi:hypothetical protein LK07_20990 [Streptomyces pluripotens]|uniref:Integral membrane protein n=1 Tax=Streptomyces pluripotens TaxID=1355015 RepID=A0A221P2R0_9ACTN|nr:MULTISPECIES: hypothetical protein [Streptomyces]ARP71825.1 hypothetical protein LK06_019830 [Streptomyces pluripotens]ASN26075.1 hypothetical protein LK07_20990 [Streptomyces pluripotens]KIE26239.1 hypothetical protein LK08_13535 [Streptomyces sp. MUSC 125]MCH0556301.1 hypothetical protein [Streptomyces sp. MUM 16J]